MRLLPALVPLRVPGRPAQDRVQAGQARVSRVCCRARARIQGQGKGSQACGRPGWRVGQQVYMARMAKGRPVTPASGKVKATKAKAAKRTRHRSDKQHMNDAGRDPEPVVAYAVSAPAGATVYMDHGAADGGPDPRLGQGHGDVIALPPLARRVRTRSVDKRKKQGSPGRFGARSQIRGHAVDGYVSFESGTSAPATDVDSGSGSEADTDGECDDVVDAAKEELGQGQGDGAEVSECESTYSGSVAARSSLRARVTMAWVAVGVVL
ncbi:hypothetical protein BCR44DRAFT_1102812 [Catenaria anguillulae PL171]|uniref:Uncharacterized protein n=1 Tax=Catenaria anguillulae PL171 TaxID=765915 RepID=A0A1Y2I604_9FUNG|nr:hypothetical protein BCR44DRAFT_1102812 [Catenaria anguillulae PL171]